MPLLFTYGTLQLEQVQLSTFGRLLAGEPDSLPGYEKTLVKIEDPEAAAAFGMTHYSSVRFTGNNASLVDGVVFDITGVELAAADEYERECGLRARQGDTSVREAGLGVRSHLFHSRSG